MPMTFEEREELYKKGASALEYGKYEEAEACFTQILEEDPNNLETLSKMGVLNIYRGDKEKGREYFQQGLDIDKDHIPSLSNMASLELEMGNTNKAEMMFRRVLNLDPNYGPAHNNLAVILKKSGRLSEAVKHMKKAQRAGTFSVQRAGTGKTNKGCLTVLIMLGIALVLWFLNSIKG